MHIPAHVVILENDCNDEDVGCHGECHHRNVEDDQQVIGLAVELVVKVPKYIPGDIHSKAFIRGHRRSGLRVVELQWRCC